jgi:hypothetical protein
MSETKQIEKYLQQQLLPEEKLLMDARCLVDKQFRDTVLLQQQTYAVIQHFGRNQLRAEICEIEKRLFSEDMFSQFIKKIQIIFK